MISSDRGFRGDARIQGIACFDAWRLLQRRGTRECLPALGVLAEEFAVGMIGRRRSVGRLRPLGGLRGLGGRGSNGLVFLGWLRMIVAQVVVGLTAEWSLRPRTESQDDMPRVAICAWSRRFAGAAG
jgi:hypothetical protein